MCEKPNVIVVSNKVRYFSYPRIIPFKSNKSKSLCKRVTQVVLYQITPRNLFKKGRYCLLVSIPSGRWRDLTCPRKGPKFNLHQLRIGHKGVPAHLIFNAPAPWPSLPPPLFKIFVSPPLFSIPPPFKVFQTVPSILTQPSPTLIQHTNFPYT